jgi:two-component system phosphate regulon sensor histidine kinase PhoR
VNISDILALILLGGVAALTIALFNHRRRFQDSAAELAQLRRDLASANDQLQAANHLMSTMNDAAFDAVFLVDSQNRVLRANQAGLALFTDSGEIIGQTLIAISRNHELDTLTGTVISGEPVLETQIELDGRSFRVRALAVKLTGKSAAILILQDITELLRLARARRDMVTNFSHDLKTPISSMRLLVDTLVQSLGRNPERDQRRLAEMAGIMDHLQHMTQELVDLSMIESGKAIIRMIPVNFAEIARNALSLMETQIEQKKLKLINDIPDILLVLADPDQTRRVIANIVHNAVKFTPSDGEIQIEAECDDQMATISIRDTGPGIPPQNRDRVFERFYQVNSARTNQSGGSGLGLAIAKHIVEAQGGKIWAEAAAPHGARIRFTIPLADQA